MSRDHTYVSRREWEAMKARVASAEAYILRRQEEASRIAALAASRRREAADIRATHQARVQQSVAQLRNAFQANVNRVKDQLTTELRSQAGALEGEIADMFTQINDTKVRISSMESRISQVAETYNAVFQELARSESDKERRAELVAAEVEHLILAMEGLSPERFVPTEYATLIAQRDNIRANITRGDSQAAIMVSQNSVIQGTQTLARLQLLNERFSQRVLEIKERASALRERIERFTSESGALSFEFNGVMQEFDYNIDFWSNGRFGELVGEFESLESLLNGDEIGLEQLEQIGQSLEVLDQNISVCDEMAREERCAALATADTVMRIHAGLNNSGWHLEESGYESDDERNPYTMNFDDGDGNTVSIVVSPSSPEGSEIFVEAFSDNEAMVEMTKDGVNALLEDQDITIEDTERSSDCHLYPDPQAFTQSALEEAREALEQRRGRE